MTTKIRFYGDIIEITKIEKTPKKVRLSRTREKRAYYTPRRQDSLRRTKQICMRRVSSALVELGSPLMFTLTFRGSASDVAYASDSLSIFQRRLRGEFPMAQSLFVPEISPRGRLHFHGLVFGVSHEFGDKIECGRVISYGKERETRKFANLWREGFVDIIQTDGNIRLAGYISKYITKGAGHPLLAPVRLVRVSKGFPREIIVNDEFLVSKIEKSLIGRVPVSVWEKQNIFLGKISKTKYSKNIDTLLT